MARLTPFGFIEGPYYTYEIYMWMAPRLTEREFIYVGRGTGWRAKTYYRFLSRTGVNRYASPQDP